MLVTKIFAVAGLAATALADGASISAALTTIQQDTTDLGNTVASWKGDLLGNVPILAKSATLLHAIKQGAKTAQASAALSDTEALSVATTTVALATAVNTTLTAIVAALPKFEKLLVVKPVVLLNLELQQDATDDLSSKIIAKVPQELQAIAQSLIDPIDQGFAYAIDQYRLF